MQEKFIPRDVVVTPDETRNGGEPFGTLEFVPISRIELKTVFEIDGVQRDPKTKDLSRFNLFDHDSFETLTLSDRQWGDTSEVLYVLNGGHRVEAVKKKVREGNYKVFPDGNRTKLPARIIKTYSLEHEGRVFIKINSECKKLEHIDRHWTLLRFKDPRTMDIDKIITANNFVIPKNNEKTDNSLEQKPTNLQCVDAVNRLYEDTDADSSLMQSHGDLLHHTLRILHLLWRGQTKVATKPMINGMAFFLRHYKFLELLDEKKLKEQLNKKIVRGSDETIGPNSILDAVDGKIEKKSPVWNNVTALIAKQIDFHYDARDGLLQTYAGNKEDLEKRRQERLKKLGQVQS